MMYTSPLADIISRYAINFHLYADDTQLYVTFKTGPRSSIEESSFVVHNCINEITKWMTVNKLKLNHDKTEVMYITSPRLRDHFAGAPFMVNSTPIDPKTSLRNLGCIMNASGEMRHQINAVCKASYFHLRNISRIRKMLTDDAAATLIHAFITARLDSCNSLLVGCTQQQIGKLQRVQNAAARVLARKTKRDSITTILKTLHWLPVRQRCLYKLLIITHKCIHGDAPIYLRELLIKHQPSRTLRSADQHLLVEKRTKTKTFGDRAFSAAAAREWNKLPLSLRESENFEHFKRILKTHLFNTAF